MFVKLITVLNHDGAAQFSILNQIECTYPASLHTQVPSGWHSPKRQAKSPRVTHTFSKTSGGEVCEREVLEVGAEGGTGLIRVVLVLLVVQLGVGLRSPGHRNSIERKTDESTVITALNSDD